MTRPGRMTRFIPGRKCLCQYCPGNNIWPRAVDGFDGEGAGAWAMARQARTEKRPLPPNSTASQISRLTPCVPRSCATWTSTEATHECVGEASSQCRDRVGDVSLGPDREIRGVDNRREGQALCVVRLWLWPGCEVLRGESLPFRRSGIRKLQSTGLRDGGSRANRGLHNRRARSPA